MGNWSSLAELKNEYSKLNIKEPLILKGKLPVKEINKKFAKSSELYVIGFDKLQIPRYLVKYKLSKRQ